MKQEINDNYLPEQIELGMNWKNLYQTLAHAAKKFPDKNAVIDDQKKLTYSQLLHEVDVFAGFLHGQLGFTSGTKVAVLQENRVDFCITFYALLKIGCTAVVLNTKLSSVELNLLLNQAQPVAAVLNASWFEKLVLPHQTAFVKKLIFTESKQVVAEAANNTVRLHSEEFFYLPEILQEGDILSGCCIDEELPAVLLFTSGVTGAPKGVILSHKNLLYSVFSYQDSLCLDHNEITVLSVPVFHITGLICVMAFMVLLGGTIVFLPRFHAAETLRMMELYKATHFHAVSTVFLLLEEELNKPGREYNLCNFHMAVCGGGAISENTIYEIKKKVPHLDFRPAYGLTETAGAGVIFPCDYNNANKPGAAGKIVPSATIAVCDGQGNDLPVGEIGEICIKGPMVTRGYYGKAPLDGGWLRTGDLGRLDEEGFVYVLDRLKDMINRGGEKVYSIEVERQAIEMPGVYQAALFAVPDALYGEVPAMAVIPASNFSITQEDIIDFLKTRVAKYKLPVDVFFVDKFPRSANGKVLKNKLREEYLKQEKSI